MGQIQTIGDQISQSVGAELRLHASGMEDKFSRSIGTSARSIETTVIRSSDTTSKSVMTEMGQILPALEVSVVNSVTQQIDTSRSSLEAAINASSAEIKSALDVYANQQLVLFSSIQDRRPEVEKRLDPKLEDSSELLNSGPVRLRERKKKKTQDQGLARRIPSSCRCNPKFGSSDPFLSTDGVVAQKGNFLSYTIRSCPLCINPE